MEGGLLGARQPSLLLVGVRRLSHGRTQRTNAEAGNLLVLLCPGSGQIGKEIGHSNEGGEKNIQYHVTHTMEVRSRRCVAERGATEVATW